MSIISIPNLITVFRVIAALTLIWTELLEGPARFFCFVICFWALDSADGYAARKLKQETQFGADLDVASDRVLDIICSLHLLISTEGPSVILCAAFLVVRFGFETLILGGKHPKQRSLPEISPVWKKIFMEASAFSKALFFGYYIAYPATVNRFGPLETTFNVLFSIATAGYAGYIFLSYKRAVG